MKILHTADWHLGIALHKQSLMEDQYDFIKQLKQIVMDENIDVIIIAGDIYDTTLASKEAIELYDKCMHMLCMELQKQVIVIAGNHDSPVRLSSCSALLAPMGLHVYGKLEEKVKPLILGNTWFYPIPYFHPQTVANLYGVEIQDEEEAFLCIQNDLEEKLNKKEVCHIAIAHTFMANASVSESDRFATIGGSGMVSSTVFDKFDYVALGHLHRHQKAGQNAYYSGSPLPYSFSEASYAKKVLIYDTDNGEIQEKCIQPLHSLKTYSGKLEDVITQLKQDNDTQSYVKIEIEDKQTTIDMMEYFQELHEGILQLSGIHEETQSRIGVDLQTMETMQDDSIVKQFFKDMFQEELDEEEMQLFYEAQKAVKEEEYAS